MKNRVCSLENRLRTLGKEKLIKLLLHLRTRYDHFDFVTLNWLKTNQKKDESVETPNETGLTDQLFLETWCLAESIIEKFNEYGGGDESEEEMAYDYLNELEEIAEKENVSREARSEVIGRAFEQYHFHNSGFDDTLNDIMFGLCKDREDWEYLASLYMKNPSRWEKEKAMEIYAEHLGDDKSYLALRTSQMKYGMDYWDLVGYYIQKGMDEKALETAERGILEGEGRCTELFSYLFDHYEKLDCTGDIDRLIRTALERKTEELEMLKRGFGYHSKKGNYNKAKEYLLAGYDHLRWGGHFDYFMKMQNYIKREEWDNIETGYLKKVKKDNLKDYLAILMQRGEKAEVLRLVLNPPNDVGGVWFRPNVDVTEEFAAKLRTDYPNEIAGYYLRRARKYILAGQRGNYRVARRYLETVRDTYLEELDDEDSWKSAITRIRGEFQKRRALLEELEGLE
ncbi:MAG: hypothetical protein AB1665_03875 [Candidatus Thermoplasmatota archaeon]